MTDTPAGWAEPVGEPDWLPIDYAPDGWFRVNNETDLARYEAWLTAHGHTLEDQ